MEAIWNNGIAFIVWFQGLGAWLIAPMKFFSSLGSAEFYLFLLPLLYWCVDTNLGLRIGVIALFSSGSNEILKLSFHGPRPYWLSTQVKAYAAERTFGIPSGHAQNGTSLWGMIAALIRRPWAWLLAIFLILMIGLSRLYLGVHFPLDLLLGWALGALTVWAFLKWWDVVAVWVTGKSLGQQVVLAFAFSALMLVLGSIALGTLRGWVLPASWLANAQQAGVDVLPSPASLENTVTSAAALFGMFTGLAWMHSRGGYDASGDANHRILRLFPGMLGSLVFYLGLRVIFPQGDGFVPYLFRYVRYALLGLWVTGGAPWLFQKLNLAHRKTPGQSLDS
jgi:membrane-associated phospholipid phosphatase